MDPIGIAQPITVSPQPAAPVLPLTPAPGAGSSAQNAMPAIGGNAAEDSFDAEAAERQRLAVIQHAAQEIANVYVVSDTKFTIFKDSTGQYITRFTSLRDGKVTYIPEPSLFKLSGSDTQPLLKIHV